MLETQFSLSWVQHMHNICYGISKFQKSGEFVDMTLAVEGCFVKVHQMILCLVSPYIKDIVLSLNSSHPVIFLSNISYQTLCSILDYVYRGEVQVSKEQLEDLIHAGKQLRIEGLQEMCLNNLSSNEISTPTECSNTATKIPDVKQDGSQENREQVYEMETDNDTQNNKENNSLEVQMLPTEGTSYTNNTEDDQITCAQSPTKEKFTNKDNCSQSTYNKDTSTPFFTTSNRGYLQLVVGKYMYYLRSNNTSTCNHCHWKCFNDTTTQCPAYVYTRNNRIIKKLTKHSHPPHDTKITRKIELGELYPNMEGAEFCAQNKIKKKQSCQPLSDNQPTLMEHLSPNASDK